MADFIAELEHKADEIEISLGSHGYGERNEWIHIKNEIPNTKMNWPSLHSVTKTRYII